MPPGTNLLTVGFKQVAVAFRECMRLKQTFLYLIFYFLMCVLPPYILFIAISDASCKSPGVTS